MIHERLRIPLFILGIVSIIVGALMYFALPIDTAFKISVERTLKSLSLEEAIGPPGPSDWGVIKAELEVIVGPLPELEAGDSHILVLNLNLKNVNFVPNAPPQIKPGIGEPSQLPDPMAPNTPRSPPKFRSEQLYDMIHQRMQRGDIAFVLSIAGAKIEPKGKNPVSKNGRTMWSVKPEGPGLLRGFIKPVFPKATGGHSGEYRVEFSTTDHIPIEVISEESIITKKFVVSGFVTFFGSLLTLPGILAFLDGQRKRREEIDAKQQEERPRIILSGGIPPHERK